MKNRLFVLGFLLAAFAAVPIMMGCSSSSTQVTLSGTVLSIDTGKPAIGVVVSVLDHPEINSGTATDASGAFTLKVDKGTPAILVTDDAVGSTADVWVPSINYEAMRSTGATFEADKTSMTVHACGNPGSPDLLAWASGQTPARTDTENIGSTAVINQYLSTVSPSAWNATSLAASGGVVVMVGAVGNKADANGPTGFAFLNNISVSTDSAECPMKYADGTKFWDHGSDLAVSSYVPDAASGPDFLLAGATATQDTAGDATAVCSTSAPGTVQITMTDNDTSRAWTFGTPWTVPVRAGYYTLLIEGVICDDVTKPATCTTNLGFFDAYCAGLPSACA